jgi:hypothetical protein
MPALAEKLPHNPREIPLNIKLFPKQQEALTSLATEILYGGAAGGGKSHLLRVAFIIYCVLIPGLQAYLFRRHYKDLIKNHMEGPKSFHALLSPWVEAGLVQIVGEEVRFWNGSRIFLCHCQHEQDVWNYQGAEIHLLGMDEGSHFTESMYTFLRSRVRMVGVKLPIKELAALFGIKEKDKKKLEDAVKALFPRILIGSNPGHIGHQWLKSYFVSPRRPYEVERMHKDEGGMPRQFIPALISDNPALERDDPNYRGKLKGMFSAALAAAMEHGDWNIVAGSFFGQDFGSKNIIKPFIIPKHWPRFMAFDWGSGVPFSAGWYAVSSGVDDDNDPLFVETAAGEDVRVPKRALIKYREWYGSSGKADQGLKMDNEDIAEGIVEREGKGEDIEYRVGGVDMWISKGGPSIDEVMSKVLKKHGKVGFSKADNKRIAGWQQVISRLRGKDGVPMAFFFNSCLDSIRTIPVLQHDPKDANDVADGEDHAAEEFRYACMSRPWSRGTVQIEEPKHLGNMTYNDLLASHLRSKKKRR